MRARFYRRLWGGKKLLLVLVGWVGCGASQERLEGVIKPPVRLDDDVRDGHEDRAAHELETATAREGTEEEKQPQIGRSGEV